jgi:hypothetical protein
MVDLVFPNPVKDDGPGFVRVFVPEGGAKVSVSLLSLSARRLTGGSWSDLAPGPHDLPIEMGFLPNGLYFVAVDMAGKRTVQKWLVLR